MREPSFGSGPGLAGAACPTHPERPALATCARCGRFMCALCQAFDTPPTCFDCRARAGDALGVGNSGMEVGATLRLAFKLLGATAPVVVAVVLIGAALGTALELGVPELSRSVARLVDRVYELTVGIVLNTAVIAAMLHATEGEVLKPGAALQEGLHAYGRMLRWRFVSGLLILLFTLLLVIPGIIKALRYAFVGMLAYKNVPDPLAASTELTEGKLGRLLGVLASAFLVFLLALAVPLVAAGLASEAAPALAVPATVFSNVCINAAERFLDASVVAAYLLLTNELARGQAAA